MEREAAHAGFVAPAPPYRRDRIEAERVVDARAAADALTALHRVRAIIRRAPAVFGTQDAHVGFALIEEVPVVMRPLLDEDDLPDTALGQRRGEGRAGGARADDEHVAVDRRQRRRCSKGPS